MIMNPIIPKLCPKASKPDFPPVPCYPFFWMRENIEVGSITDIDGFVINEDKGRVTALMQRREYYPKDYDSVSDENLVLNSILKSENKLEWVRRCILSETLKVPLYLVLWPEDYPAKEVDIAKPVIVYEVKKTSDSICLRKEFRGSISNLSMLIRSFRERYFDRVKLFKISMTMMECHMAWETRDPWPGNLDAIVWDEKKKSFEAIIEFKTHNHPRYRVKDQYFGQWEGDERRYKAFDILQKHLGDVSTKPKFIYVIWGTQEVHKEIKLQTIDDLKAYDDELIKRPEFTDATTKDFTQEVLRYISK